MSEGPIAALETALQTVMAVARNQGLDIDELCRHSIGAIISGADAARVDAAQVENAIAAIEQAQAAVARLSLPSA
ncbi:hypothetical protein D3C76_1054560 [compost metagenome]